MKKFIKTIRWNIGVFILAIGYKIRGEVPMRLWGKNRADRFNGKKREHPLDEMYYIK